MKLKSILNGIEGLKARGNLDINIESIEIDSRKVKDGSMFIAIDGTEVDGHDYIKSAVENGAKVIMIEEGRIVRKSEIKEDTVIVMAPNTRKAASKIACNFYNNPSARFKLIGVTGTKGKTTTTFMIKKILEEHGLKVGLIGTVANYIGDKNLGESTRTTPDSISIQKLFNDMVEAKVDVVVMEVSSLGVKYNRIDDCDFDIGLFTNFSEDHISKKEHQDMEEYFKCKVDFIKMCRTSLINADDFHVAKVKKLLPDYNITTYGIDNMNNLTAKDITVTNSSVDFKVKLGTRNEIIKVGVPGRFSVYNALGAIGIVNNFGVTADEIKNALLEIKVPGRSEIIPNNKDITIMIDYAHSPESLKSILGAIKNYTRGRLVSVFGCGGDRDNLKRPIMGKISGDIADFTIITSDNPRTEKPEDIIEEIEKGIKKSKGEYKVIIDRKEAIKYAIEKAHKNDIIILSGKGHETYQEINGEKFPFDERDIIKEILK